MLIPVLIIACFILGLLVGTILEQSCRPVPNSKIKSLENQLETARDLESRYFKISIKAIRSRDEAVKRYVALRDQVIEDTMNTDHAGETGPAE